MVVANNDADGLLIFENMPERPYKVTVNNLDNNESIEYLYSQEQEAGHSAGQATKMTAAGVRSQLTTGAFDISRPTDANVSDGMVDPISTDNNYSISIDSALADINDTTTENLMCEAFFNIDNP